MFNNPELEKMYRDLGSKQAYCRGLKMKRRTLRSKERGNITELTKLITEAESAIDRIHGMIYQHKRRINRETIRISGIYLIEFLAHWRGIKPSESLTRAVKEHLLLAKDWQVVDSRATEHVFIVTVKIGESDDKYEVNYTLDEDGILQVTRNLVPRHPGVFIKQLGITLHREPGTWNPDIDTSTEVALMGVISDMLLEKAKEPK